MKAMTECVTGEGWREKSSRGRAGYVSESSIIFITYYNENVRPGSYHKQDEIQVESDHMNDLKKCIEISGKVLK